MKMASVRKGDQIDVDCRVFAVGERSSSSLGACYICSRFLIFKSGRKPGQKESEEENVREKTEAEFYTVWLLAFATSLAVGKGLKG